VEAKDKHVTLSTEPWDSELKLSLRYLDFIGFKTNTADVFGFGRVANKNFTSC